MARTININKPFDTLTRLLISVLLLIVVAVAPIWAKPLSQGEHAELCEIARSHHAMTQLEGASVYRFKGQDILLVIVDVKKTPNSQRVGQVKASRTAGEFLQSASNKSVTVYAVSDDNSYSFSDKSEEKSSTAGTSVSDRISQCTSDMSTTSTEETFSDKIVQSSLTRVGHIEPLCRLADDSNSITFAYFMILEK